MRTAIKIRQATKGDLETIYEMARAYLHEIGEVRRDALRRQIGQGRVFLALVGNRPAGFLSMTLPKRGFATIIKVLVIGTERRRGVGRSLVGVARRRARLAGKYHLYAMTRPGNTAAERFYRALGFQLVGATTANGGHGRNEWRVAL